MNDSVSLTPGTWIALVTLMLALFAAYGGVILWITSRLTALSEKQALDIGALRDTFSERVDKVQAIEAEARNRLNAEFAKDVTDIRTDIRQFRDNSATKVEISAMESRLTAQISKAEQRTGRIEERLEELPKIAAAVTLLTQLVEKISARFSERGLNL